MPALSHGVLGIAAERRRQIEEKGWSFAHDDDHKEHELQRICGADVRLEDVSPMWSYATTKGVA